MKQNITLDIPTSIPLNSSIISFQPRIEDIQEEILLSFNHISSLTQLIPPLEILKITSFEFEANITKGDGYCGSYSIESNAQLHNLEVVSNFKELGTWLNSIQISQLVRKYFDRTSSIFLYSDFNLEYDYIKGDIRIFIFKNSYGMHWESCFVSEKKRINQLNFINISQTVMNLKGEIVVKFEDYYSQFKESDSYIVTVQKYQDSNDENIKIKNIIEADDSKALIPLNLIQSIVKNNIDESKEQKSIDKIEIFEYNKYKDPDIIQRINELGENKKAIALLSEFQQIVRPIARFSDIIYIDFNKKEHRIKLKGKLRFVGNFLQSNIFDFNQEIKPNIVGFDSIYLNERIIPKYFNRFTKMLLEKYDNLIKPGYLEIVSQIELLEKSSSISNISDHSVEQKLNDAKKVKLNFQQYSKKYPWIKSEVISTINDFMDRFKNSANIIEDNVYEEEIRRIKQNQALSKQIDLLKSKLAEIRKTECLKIIKAELSSVNDPSILQKKLELMKIKDFRFNSLTRMTTFFSECDKYLKEFITASEKSFLINMIFVPKNFNNSKSLISAIHEYGKSLGDERILPKSYLTDNLILPDLKLLTNLEQIVKKILNIEVFDVQASFLADMLSILCYSHTYILIFIKTIKGNFFYKIYLKEFCNVTLNFTSTRINNKTIIGDVVRLSKMVKFPVINDKFGLFIYIDKITENLSFYSGEIEFPFQKSEKCVSFNKPDFLDTFYIHLNSEKKILISNDNDLSLSIYNILQQNSLNARYNTLYTSKDFDEIKTRIVEFENYFTLSLVSAMQTIHSENLLSVENLIKDYNCVVKNIKIMNEAKDKLIALNQEKASLVNIDKKLWKKPKKNLNKDYFTKLINKYRSEPDKYLEDYNKLMTFIEEDINFLEKSSDIVEIFEELAAVSQKRFHNLNQELTIAQLLPDYPFELVYERLMKWMKVRHDCLGLLFVKGLGFDVEFLDVSLGFIDESLIRTPDYIKFNPKNKKLLIMEFAYYQTEFKGNLSKGFNIQTSKYFPEIRTIWQAYGKKEITEIIYFPVVFSKESTMSGDLFKKKLIIDINNVISNFLQKRFIIDEGSTFIKNIMRVCELINNVSSQMVYKNQCFNFLLNKCVLNKKRTIFNGTMGMRSVVEYNSSFIDLYVNNCNFNIQDKTKISTFLHYILGKYFYDMDGEYLLECMDKFVLLYSNITYDNEEDILIDYMTTYQYILILLKLIRRISERQRSKIKKDAYKLKHILSSMKFDYVTELDEDLNTSESGSYKLVTDFYSLLSHLNLNLLEVNVKKITSDSSQLMLNESNEEFVLNVYANPFFKYNSPIIEKKPGNFLTSEPVIRVENNTDDIFKELNKRENIVQEDSQKSYLEIKEILLRILKVINSYESDSNCISIICSLFSLCYSQDNSLLEFTSFRQYFTKLKQSKKYLFIPDSLIDNSSYLNFKKLQKEKKMIEYTEKINKEINYRLDFVKNQQQKEFEIKFESEKRFEKEKFLIDLDKRLSQLKEELENKHKTEVNKITEDLENTKKKQK